MCNMVLCYWKISLAEWCTKQFFGRGNLGRGESGGGVLDRGGREMLLFFTVLLSRSLLLSICFHSLSFERANQFCHSERDCCRVRKILVIRCSIVDALHFVSCINFTLINLFEMHKQTNCFYTLTFQLANVYNNFGMSMSCNVRKYHKYTLEQIVSSAASSSRRQ